MREGKGVTAQIVGSAGSNQATPLDGRWLVDFGPCSEDEADAHVGENEPAVMYGAAPSVGGVCPIKIVTTDDPAQARVFKDAAEAHALWAMVMPPPFDKRLPDGKPNRPLTAYHIQVEKL